MLAETLELKAIPSSQIPGRPKKWKNKCTEMLETSISNKYEYISITHTCILYMCVRTYIHRESIHMYSRPIPLLSFPPLSLFLSLPLSIFRFEKLDTTAEERMENKEWLTDHLTEVAGVCYQDLQGITTAGVKCFPASYNIVSFFVKRYHRGLVGVVSRKRTYSVHMCCVIECIYVLCY